MKHLSIFLFNFLFATAVFSQTQTGYQVIIRVIDADTDKPVQGALVSLKEKGWQTEKADANGKVVFKDVMSRDVNFTVTAEGYLRAEENKNVAEQQESNTFEVKLKKPNAERVLIVGEVTDQNGKDVAGATVEFKLVNILKETKTDASGNYMIEIDLNELKVSSTEGELEAKKGECKVKEKILVNQKVISKDIKLDCQAGTTKPVGGEPTAPTGDFGNVCFKNLVKSETYKNISLILIRRNTDGVIEYQSQITIPSQEEKCFYNLQPGVYSYSATLISGSFSRSGNILGQVLVEKGKIQTIGVKE